MVLRVTIVESRSKNWSGEALASYDRALTLRPDPAEAGMKPGHPPPRRLLALAFRRS